MLVYHSIKGIHSAKCLRAWLGTKESVSTLQNQKNPPINGLIS